jgi:hypothetical protein
MENCLCARHEGVWGNAIVLRLFLSSALDLFSVHLQATVALPSRKTPLVPNECVFSGPAHFGEEISPGLLRNPTTI